MNHSKPHLSEVLEHVAEQAVGDRVSVGDIMTALEDRATAALLLIFAFPNALVAPPGTSGILGLPMAYLSFQLMMGRAPHLPAFISRRSMPREDFQNMIRRVIPRLARAERLLVPCYPALTGDAAIRGAGAVCLLLSLILMLPIPFGNMLPAVAVCVITLGLLERDGRWLIGGTVVGIISLFVAAGVMAAFAKAALMVMS